MSSGLQQLFTGYHGVLHSIMISTATSIDQIRNQVKPALRNITYVFILPACKWTVSNLNQHIFLWSYIVSLASGMVRRPSMPTSAWQVGFNQKPLPMIASWILWAEALLAALAQHVNSEEQVRKVVFLLAEPAVKEVKVKFSPGVIWMVFTLFKELYVSFQAVRARHNVPAIDTKKRTLILGR